MTPIKDYENEFTVLQANKAIEIIGELIEASQSRMDLLEGIKIDDLQFKGIANNKTKQAEKKRLEEEYNSKLMERLIETRGLKEIIKAGVINKITMARPDLLAKFGALLFSENDEVFTNELYAKRVLKFQNMKLKDLKELKVLEEVNNFLLGGITGILATFQLSMPTVN